MKRLAGRPLATVALLSSGICATLARAQCPTWSDGFAGSGVTGQIEATSVFDDGHGPALYAAGDFSAASGVSASNIAKWSGHAWSAVGPGTNNTIDALLAFDDGTGPALYAGGVFVTAGGIPARHIARWNGATWSAVGNASSFAIQVRALAAFDDGTGRALYAAGVPDVPYHRAIARWDGTSWSTISTPEFGSSVVFSGLVVFDDGTGKALYASGSFESASGGETAFVAKWNGHVWRRLGDDSMDGGVWTLAVFDGGSRPALYAAGQFTHIGNVAAKSIAKWTSLGWSAVGGGIVGTVDALSVFDEGSGAALYAGGNFAHAGGVGALNVAKWDGSAWSGVGQGIGPADIRTLCGFDDGTTPALYAGGQFNEAGGSPARSFAKWNGSTWGPESSGEGVDGVINALAVASDGGKTSMYACGYFGQAGMDDTVNAIAEWDGTQWSHLGSGWSWWYGDEEFYVDALANYDDGTGTALYVAGQFYGVGGHVTQSIAKWNGQSWFPVGSGFNLGDVWNLTVFDDGSGSALYAGGEFTYSGNLPVHGIAKWNGSAWSALGTGTNGYVYGMGVFDDGAGRALYAGGSFTTAGGTNASSIAKWNGTSWSALGSGVAGGSYPSVFALTSFDDGSGPALFVGGDFRTAGGIDSHHIAKWNGSSWSSPAGGTGGEGGLVFALAVFDDGSGPALYAAGDFSSIGGVPARNIAKWDGVVWSRLESGIEGGISSLCVFDDGSGPALYAGGQFGTAGGKPSSCVAKWKGCGN
jgi:hypothetical protein